MSIQKSIENLSQPSVDNFASFTIQQLNLKSSSRLGTITEGEEDFCKSKSSVGDRFPLPSGDNPLKGGTNPSLPTSFEYRDMPANSKKLFSERVPSPKPIVHEELSPSFGEEKPSFHNLWRHQEIVQGKHSGNTGNKLSKKEPLQFTDLASRQKSLPSKPDVHPSQNQIQFTENLAISRKSKPVKTSDQAPKIDNQEVKKVFMDWQVEEQAKFHSALNKLGRLEGLITQLQQQVSRSRATQIIF